MKSLITDVAIIGAGTAGLAAERSARRAGARTLLIDEFFNGTTCALVGCMPSKLLIAAAAAAHAVRDAPLFGIASAGTLCVDGRAVMARVRRERDAFVAATLEALEKDVPRADRLKARARFSSANSLELSNGDRVSCKASVIATGSRAFIPERYRSFADLVLTNDSLFELPVLPESIAVIGAGPLGLEMAQALARLGVRTRVFDEESTIASLHDSTVAARLRSVLEQEFPLSLGVSLDIQCAEHGVAITWSGRSHGTECFDRLLVAAGRPPNLHDLDLQVTGLALDGKGLPGFDRHTMQCGNFPIFLAGDANADRPVLHEAAAEGGIAGRNAASFPEVTSCKRMTPLSIMFSDPPLAVVGEPANEHGVVGTASYDHQGRATVEKRNQGMVSVYADRPDGVITGAVLLAPGADHFAHLIAWAIEQRQTAAALLEMPMYHPTVEEGLKPALRSICAELGSIAEG